LAAMIGVFCKGEPKISNGTNLPFFCLVFFAFSFVFTSIAYATPNPINKRVKQSLAGPPFRTPKTCGIWMWRCSFPGVCTLSNNLKLRFTLSQS
jgi:hypothetical protein